MTNNSIQKVLPGIVVFIALMFLSAKHTTQPDKEIFWLGVTSMGHEMPISDSFELSLIDNTHGNQVQPLILSNHGSVVWSEEPFSVKCHGNKIEILESKGKIIEFDAGENLKDAYLYASKNYFPPQGILPEELLFMAPQYNTWIELMYDQNQEDILKYAHDIINNGFPPGVLMIDDNWQEDYGKWDFHPGRFPDPKAMMEELSELGFKVMLWVCPFVSPDCDVYRDLASKGAFLVKEDKQQHNSTLPTFDFRGNPLPQPIVWWNGISAVLDLSNPVAEDWFKKQLDYLQTEYGVGGFKFDAGDAEFYYTGKSNGNVSANEQAALFGKVGLDYPLNEYRAMWKMGGQPLVQRLRDKFHSWEDLEKLVPSMALQGLLGYYFNCPDMIGGGDFTSFIGKNAKIDQELIVRSAQCHALMPMMQFSVAPWRILDSIHFAAVKASVEVRNQFIDYILEEAKKTAQSGEPILRPMEYEYPHKGYSKISQQFFIGEKLLVAPITQMGIETHNVVLPAGKWKAYNGKIYKGNRTVQMQVTINDLPYFEKQ